MPKTFTDPEKAREAVNVYWAQRRQRELIPRIADLIGKAPPLTDDQRRELAAIIGITPADLPCGK